MTLFAKLLYSYSRINELENRSVLTNSSNFTAKSIFV